MDAAPAADPVSAIIAGDFGQLDEPEFRTRFTALEIATTSMTPNLRPGDFTLVDTTAAQSAPIVRGDLIAFTPTAGQLANCGVTRATFVKRVIGVGGDHVEVVAAQRAVNVNGAPLDVANAQPNPGQGPGGALPRASFDVPAGTLFVLGDNRTNSCDSHQWTDPYVPVANVAGPLVGIYFQRRRTSLLHRGGTIERVPVAVTPERLRLEYVVILGRVILKIGECTDAIRACAKSRSCRPNLKVERLRLAGQITAQLNVLRGPAQRLAGDCAAPAARRLANALGSDRRTARRARLAIADAKRLAAATERHLFQAVTKAVACWT